MNKIINLVFLLFLSVVLYLAINFSNYYHPNNFKNASVLIGVLGFTFLIANYLKNKKDAFALSFLVFLSLVIRLIFLYIFRNYSQVSDFLMALESGISGSYVNSLLYARFPHWAFYPIVVEFISQLRFIPAEIGVKIFQAIVNSLIVLPLFFVVKNTISRQVAIVSSILFALYFPNALYTQIVTPEHLSGLFFLTTVAVWIKIKKTKTIDKRIWLLLSSASFLALANLLRPMGIVFVFYFAIDSIVSDKKQILGKITSFAIFLVIYLVFNALTNQYLTYKLGLPINRHSTIPGIYAGLNSKCNGFWCKEISINYQNTLEKTSYSYEETSAIILEELKKDLAENYSSLPSRMWGKFKNNWTTDTHPIFWVANGEENSLQLENDPYLSAHGLSVLLHFSYIIVIASNLIFIVKNKSEKNLFTQMIVLGFVGASFFTESQERYKSVIMPILFVYAGEGISIVQKNIKIVMRKMYPK